MSDDGGGSCIGKQGFKSSKAAGDVVRRMAKRGKKVATVRVYACEVCGLWHFGNWVESPADRLKRKVTEKK